MLQAKHRHHVGTQLWITDTARSYWVCYLRVSKRKTSQQFYRGSETNTQLLCSVPRNYSQTSILIYYRYIDILHVLGDIEQLHKYKLFARKHA